MSRAPFQVLVIPFHVEDDGTIRYALFRRTEDEGGYWQGIAGGGEDEEDPEETARRESYEEAGIALDSRLIPLSTVTMIPVVNVSGFEWGPEVLVIPEHAFGIETSANDLPLSDEHLEFVWTTYSVAHHLFKWDSNRTALWELDHRLTHPNRPMMSAD